MPVTIAEASKAPPITYAIIGAIALAIIFVIVEWHSLHAGEPRIDPSIYLVILVVIFGSANIWRSCEYIKSAPSEDTNIAYVNTSYSEQFLLEGSFPKAEDLRGGTTSDEKRLLYSGHDLEKVIKGNQYYIFKLSQIKTDKESAEEIVEKFH